jgi:hypothetical protein
MNTKIKGQRGKQRDKETEKQKDRMADMQKSIRQIDIKTDGWNMELLKD